jgi:hypothetical protein
MFELFISNVLHRQTFIFIHVDLRVRLAITMIIFEMRLSLYTLLALSHGILLSRTSPVSDLDRISNRKEASASKDLTELYDVAVSGESSLLLATTNESGELG